MNHVKLPGCNPNKNQTLPETNRHRIWKWMVGSFLLGWRNLAGAYCWWFWNPNNHLACMKPYKKWDKLPFPQLVSLPDFWTINSMLVSGRAGYPPVLLDPSGMTFASIFSHPCPQAWRHCRFPWWSHISTKVTRTLLQWRLPQGQGMILEMFLEAVSHLQVHIGWWIHIHCIHLRAQHQLYPWKSKC